ncbi:hypothetical protein Bhyg_09700 [Pseudolycoriella hygida]|uniref:Uncharacterized protein n=1 Tax=Pseudolycoriella hygida TaxID=35572 RepID=A0A9Q0MSN7_9DIPT|nr:hypothetical protein Bhyg_09700 [Pseudolycoriella hygida]
MDDKNNAVKFGKNVSMYTKLNQDCRVLLKEITSTAAKRQPAPIVKRRQSVRLAEKSKKYTITRILEPPKKTIKLHDVKVSNMFNDKADSVNNTQAIHNDFADLSDNVIYDLISEMAGFIQNGTWENSTSIPSDFSTNANMPVPKSNISTSSTQTGTCQDSVSTQTYFDDQRSISTQTYFSEQRSIQTQTTKRWNNIEPAIPQVQNFGATVSTTNGRRMRYMNNFDCRLDIVSGLLQHPCRRFLNREECELFCPLNHLLPSADLVAIFIQDWSDEMIHFFYYTHVQHYFICYVTYFRIICNTYADRRLVNSILSTVIDCERFAIFSNLKVIWMGLHKCGYSRDEALFAICTHVNTSSCVVNEILKIMTTYHLANFKQTVGFLSNQMQNYKIHAHLANAVLKQSYDVKRLDINLVEFCCGIIKQCISNKTVGALNYDYLHKLSMKAETQ